jgi:hypothetical protein
MTYGPISIISALGFTANVAGSSLFSDLHIFLRNIKGPYFTKNLGSVLTDHILVLRFSLFLTAIFNLFGVFLGGSMSSL